jgi:hypothetical protein
VARTKSKEAWDVLQQAYKEIEKIVGVKLKALRREFEILCMHNLESMQDFFTRVMGIVNQIRSHREDLTNQKIVINNLRSLPDKI